MDSEAKIKLLESVNTFYKLKNQYDDINLKLRRKIIKNEELSWKEKRVEFKKLRPKCINCKRPFGTLFSISYNPEESGRKLMAVCGDRTNPCLLNIVINLGNTSNHIIENEILEKEIKSIKNTIIKDKNNLIFGYINSSDAVSKFESLKEKLYLNLSYYEFTLQSYLDEVDNSTKKNEIKRIQVSIYEDINAIKRLITQFNSGENVQFISDAVEIYINQLEPKIQKNNTLKYSYRAVEYDSDDDTYNFIQKQYVIDDIETNYSEHAVGVVSLKMGFDSKQKKSKVTTKETNKAAKPIMVIESDSEEEENE